MNRRIYLIILYVVTLLAVIYGLSRFVVNPVVGCSRGINKVIHIGKLSGNTSTEEWDKSKIGSFESVSVDASVAEIILTYGSENRVKYSGPEELKPSVSVKDGKTLSIVQPELRNRFWGVNNADGKITIEIDRDIVPESVLVDASVGSVMIKNITCNNLKAVADVGELTVEDVTVNGKTSLETNTGELLVKKSSLKDTSLESAIGSVKLKDSKFENLDVEANLGSIRVDCDINEDDYFMDFSVDLGSISVNGKNYTKSYNSGDSSAKYKMNISSNLGSIDVNY